MTLFRVFFGLYISVRTNAIRFCFLGPTRVTNCYSDPACVVVGSRDVFRLVP